MTNIYTDTAFIITQQGNNVNKISKSLHFIILLLNPDLLFIQKKTFHFAAVYDRIQEENISLEVILCISQKTL